MVLMKDQERLNYPQYLKDYVNKHKLSEFIDIINPLLKSFTDSSKEIILKLDIKTTSSLAKLLDIKKSLANILGLKSAALRILDIKKGCVLVTLLLPAHLADTIFSTDRKFTTEEINQFRDLSILWLKCNGCTFEIHER